MLTSAKKSNGFDICNRYLSSKSAINGNPIKEVRKTIIKTGFLNSFFIFYHISLCFCDFIIIAFLKIQLALNHEGRLLLKIQIGILQPVKNLMFFLSKSKNQKERSFGLQPRDETER